MKSFICGYHVYKEDWEPKLNEERELRREPDNQVDPNNVELSDVWRDCKLNQAFCSSQSDVDCETSESGNQF